jgi:hypothetical protein
MYALLSRIDAVLNGFLKDIAVEHSQAIRCKAFSDALILRVVAASIKGTIAVVKIYTDSTGGM